VKILSRYTTYREWNSAQALYNAGNYENALDHYHRLFPKMNSQKQFIFEYARCLSETNKSEASNAMLNRYLLFGSNPMIYNCMGDNYKSISDYEKAETMYLRAMQIVPSRFLPLYLLMKLYDESGQTEKALATARELLEKPVKVPSQAIKEMHEKAREIEKINETE